MPDSDALAPLIVHVIYRLDVGGLENGLVNLINRIPADRYRQAIICLSDYSDFRLRLDSPEVPVIALHKRDGKDLAIYWRLWRELRRLKPNIVHTRNLGTVDMVLPAWLAGVKYRVHGEHGWDMVDLHGEKRKYRTLRRLCQPLIDRYIAVSTHLAHWLHEEAGISQNKIVHICNGVDSRRFAPRGIAGKKHGEYWIGTVGRLAEVKDQMTLVRAFATLLADTRDSGIKLRLAIVGDGPLRHDIEALVSDEGLQDVVWMPGKQDRIDKVLHKLDLFVLPSLNEGISNTILEAMASGLPVIATNVGGNPELVDDGQTGCLVPAADSAGLAQAMLKYTVDNILTERHGRKGREEVERRFSLAGMVEQYTRVYDGLLGNQDRARRR